MAEPTEPAADPTVAVDGPGYAAAVDELEAILDQLDDDALDVDVLVTRVRRAAELIGLCRARIDAARVEVDHVVAQLGEAPATPASATGTGTLADGEPDDA
jgi:exodeoxyribonuclease VII small subunit